MDNLTKSPRLNKLLAQMGIFSYYDVINHLPRRYDDLTYTKERGLEDKARVVLFGTIMTTPRETEHLKLHITYFGFKTENGTYFQVKAFNRSYLAKNIKVNDEYTIIGVFDRSKNEINLVNLYKGKFEEKDFIKPVYTLPQDYQQHLYISLVKKSLKELQGKIYPVIPYYYINKYRLCNKEQALTWAHFPETKNQIKESLRHLKYEEALLFSLKNQMINQENKSLAKIKKEPIDLSLCKPLLDTLPYELTEDQKKVCDEIIEDMNQSSLMYRLLQGDVGTGKTLVSFICLYANYVRGDQGALMAPTDVLAKQHYANALEIFKDTKLKIALLVGSTPASEKKEIYRQLEDGDIDIIIGTHALFTKSVIYSSLGLVVIDEQHRFGVNQRIALANKGEHADLLMMSATPIPRSLALTIYGDLDVSTLTSFPNKKRSVITKVYNSDSDKIFSGVDWALSEHKQIYIIAPLIDFREDERYSVEKLFARFALKYHEKVGSLHGKMSAKEKEEVLNKFASGEKPILISTSVVEVGIDVKTAGLMIIYDANNFSLASLHQLRGRIGRDGNISYCLLISDSDDETAIQKLDVLKNSNDGFAIAEEDMKLRGPGELTGIRQSGLPDFSFLNVIDDYRIFITARDDAREIIKSNDPHFEFIKKKVKQSIESLDRA